MTLLQEQTTTFVTWQGSQGWHQHYDATAIEAAQPFVATAQMNDFAPFRLSGIWANRTNFNLWRSTPRAYVADQSDIVHGYIDTTRLENIPRYRFLGDIWAQDKAAYSAQLLLIKAFAEWSCLQAGNSPLSGQRLETGLGFALTTPNDSEAEIELVWQPLASDVAASTNRSIRQDGVVTRTRSTFNAANHWWFGMAATTPAEAMHFYSSALHEIGHIIGLWDTRDRDSIMVYHRNRGPFGPSFDALDDGSKRAAYALYSRPAL
jgi:hypothetical protein